MIKFYLFLSRYLAVFLLCITVTGYAQQRTVSGKVTASEDGSPLPGVNVLEKGTSNGTATDANGEFKISVGDNATLTVSFVGYKPQDVEVGARATVDVVMESDITSLSEVVVVGYGEMRKSDVTAAMSNISSKDINRTVNTTLDQAIQGRAPGVYVTQNSGTPGGGVSVNIRGVNSLNGTNEPLYVIDGVQIQGSTSTSGTNPTSNLNPADIENIEILQGPNATAIYGSRATNGVVLITTKRGKSGDMKINYSYTVSVQDRPKELDIMNLQQYATMYNDYAGNQPGAREDFKDPSLLGKGTDWQRALFQQATMQKHQISFSGGTDKSSFYLSGERMTQGGVGLNSGFNRTSVRLNTDNKPRKWLSLSSNIMVSQTDQKLGTMGVDASNLWNNLLLNAVQLAPDIPVRNIDGTFGAGNPSVDPNQQYTPPNPVGIASILTNNVTTRTLLGGVSAGIKIIKGLELRSNFNTNIGYSNSTQFRPSFYFGKYAQNTQAQSRLTNSTNLNTYWLWNQMLTYDNTFGKHHINAMALHESQVSYYKNLSGTRLNFPTNNVLDLNAGDQTTASNSGGQGTWAMESYLARVNYNYDNRYIVTAAYRADGSANFGPANKWGSFPSVSAAWRVSNEKFFQSAASAINDLRLRFETGVTGNQGSSGAIYGTFNSGPSEWGSSYSPQIYPNPGLKWEQTKTYNYGLTLGLLNGRIQLDADYYMKKTSNLILASTLPWYMGSPGSNGSSGINPPVVNVGSLQNNGWSASITTENINTGGFKWTSNLNVSSFKPKVTALTSATGQIFRTLGQPKGGNNAFFEQTVVGQAPWQFFGYVQQGVFKNMDDLNNSPKTVNNDGSALPIGVNGLYVGDAKFKDVSGPNGKPDGIIDAHDKTSIGNPWPSWFGGFTNNFSYKGFELSMLITFSYGNKIYNLTRDEETTPYNISVGRNMFVGTLDYAKVTTGPDGNPYVSNPNTVVPRISNDPTINGNFNRYTSTYVENGSYARLKNVTLSYNLPKSLLGKQNVIQGVRVSVAAQNLVTVTKYKGMDPEVGSYVGPSYGGDVISSNVIGVDYGRYPLTRMYSFSIGVDF